MHSPATTPDDAAATPAPTSPKTPPEPIHAPQPTATTAAASLTKRTFPDVGSPAHIPLKRIFTTPDGEPQPELITAPATPSQSLTTTSTSTQRARHRITAPRPRMNKWLHYAATHPERGMSTAEYAVGTIAACAFAALLFKVVSSSEVQEMLTSLIDRALKTTVK
ncbi:DUF4244 domain-containing protein [Nonomuraea sp. MG754425]|uniref:DUF4244 domain-containing protein n=1 Tax=Nonomuraea sp. MG754425 TaxID=2570319 RepID=UPI0023513DBB|nr:DUF4244 domain-containing protein [Nonomuraea sp. MG754425]